MAGALAGKHILVLEDDYLAALDLENMIEERGGAVVGPAAGPAEAQALCRDNALDAAVLNVELNGERVFALAAELVARDIAVVLVTGYDTTMLPERFRDTPRIAKPYTESALERTLRRLLETD